MALALDGWIDTLLQRQGYLIDRWVGMAFQLSVRRVHCVLNGDKRIEVSKVK